MDHGQESQGTSGARASSAHHHQLPHFFHGDGADCDHLIRAVVWWHGDGDAHGSRFLHACTQSRGENFVPGNPYLAEADLAAADIKQGGAYTVVTRQAGANGRQSLTLAAEAAVEAAISPV